MSTATLTKPMAASEKQLAFITTLRQDRALPTVEENERVWAVLGHIDAGTAITVGTASSLIDYLLKRPYLIKVPTVTDTGVFVLKDGRIVKVQLNRSKTATYTKVWTVISGERLIDHSGEHVHGEWKYAPGLREEALQSRRMSLAEAKEFIIRYGHCVRCGRKLKAAKSVEAGIGPVCVKYFSFGTE